MAKENGKTITNREVKNSAFITYFGDPENASKLYAALGDEEVTPDDITYVTLEKLLDEKMIYRRKQFKIPTPEFYVFYNGDESYPPEKTLRLSEAFLEKTEHPMVELEVKVININLPSGHKLLKECRPMYEYSWFIQRIKDYLTAGWVRDAAIIQAVRDCQDEGILVEFMKNHGSEVVNMLNTQWDFDDAIAIEREEAFEDGRKAGIELGKMAGIAEGKAAGIAEGKAAGIIEGKTAGIIEGERQVIYTFLERLGEIPKDIRRCIEEEQDEKILKRWYTAAPDIKSFEDFREYMNEK